MPLQTIKLTLDDTYKRTLSQALRLKTGDNTLHVGNARPDGTYPVYRSQEHPDGVPFALWGEYAECQTGFDTGSFANEDGKAVYYADEESKGYVLPYLLIPVPGMQVIVEPKPKIPRGRNGGRKPKAEGEKVVRSTKSLFLKPAEHRAMEERYGNPSKAIRAALEMPLQDASPEEWMQFIHAKFGGTFDEEGRLHLPIKPTL